MNKEQLKIQALLERVSELTVQYENKVADLRVEVTTLSLEKNELQNEINERERLDSESLGEAAEQSDPTD